MISISFSLVDDDFMELPWFGRASSPSNHTCSFRAPRPDGVRRGRCLKGPLSLSPSYLPLALPLGRYGFFSQSILGSPGELIRLSRFQTFPQPRLNSPGDGIVHFAGFRRGCLLAGFVRSSLSHAPSQLNRNPQLFTTTTPSQMIAKPVRRLPTSRHY